MITRASCVPTEILTLLSSGSRRRENRSGIRKNQTMEERERDADTANQFGVDMKPKHRFSPQQVSEDRERRTDQRVRKSPTDPATDSPGAGQHSEEIHDPDFSPDMPIAGQVYLDAALEKAVAKHEDTTDRREYEILEDEADSRKNRRRKGKEAPARSRSKEGPLAAVKLEGEDDYELVELEM